MICPTCNREGRKSRLYSEGTAVVISTLATAEAYYDELGEPHQHDPNQHRANHRCSNGHRVLHVRVYECPAWGCDWNRANAKSFWELLVD